MLCTIFSGQQEYRSIELIFDRPNFAPQAATAQCVKILLLFLNCLWAHVCLAQGSNAAATTPDYANAVGGLVHFNNNQFEQSAALDLRYFRFVKPNLALGARTFVSSERRKLLSFGDDYTRYSLAIGPSMRNYFGLIGPCRVFLQSSLLAGFEQQREEAGSFGDLVKVNVPQVEAAASLGFSIDYRRIRFLTSLGYLGVSHSFATEVEDTSAEIEARTDVTLTLRTSFGLGIELLF